MSILTGVELIVKLRETIVSADEPTGNLDRKIGERIAGLVFSGNRDFAITLNSGNS